MRYLMITFLEYERDCRCTCSPSSPLSLSPRDDPMSRIDFVRCSSAALSAARARARTRVQKNLNSQLYNFHTFSDNDLNASVSSRDLINFDAVTLRDILNIARLLIIIPFTLLAGPGRGTPDGKAVSLIFGALGPN